MALALLMALLLACSGIDVTPEASLTGSDADLLAEARIHQYRGETKLAWEAYLRLGARRPDFLAAWEGAVRTATSEWERERTAIVLDERAAGSEGGEARAFRTLRSMLETNLVRREEILYRLLGHGGHLFGWPHSALADIYFERGNPTAALQAYEAALAATPGLARAHLGRARSLMALGRPLEAVAPYERYLSSHPRDPIALYNLGWILLKWRDRPRDARPYLERALAILPDDVATLLALGSAALSEERPDLQTARSCFVAAFEKDQDDPDIHWNLGVLYADHLLERRRAAFHFREYLRLGGSGLERVQRWIDELESREVPP